MDILHSPFGYCPANLDGRSLLLLKIGQKPNLRIWNSGSPSKLSASPALGLLWEILTVHLGYSGRQFRSIKTLAAGWAEAKEKAPPNKTPSRSFIELQSSTYKHLKGQLGPRVRQSRFFIIKEVSWGHGFFCLRNQQYSSRFDDRSFSYSMTSAEKT